MSYYQSFKHALANGKANCFLNGRVTQKVATWTVCRKLRERLRRYPSSVSQFGNFMKWVYVCTRDDRTFFRVHLWTMDSLLLKVWISFEGFFLVKTHLFKENNMITLITLIKIYQYLLPFSTTFSYFSAILYLPNFFGCPERSLSLIKNHHLWTI